MLVNPESTQVNLQDGAANTQPAASAQNKAALPAD